MEQRSTTNQSVNDIDAWVARGRGVSIESVRPRNSTPENGVELVELNGVELRVEYRLEPWGYYVPQNAPYVKYTYEALVKRSTKRLIKMYAKTFGVSRRSAANVERYTMIDSLYEELNKYYSESTGNVKVYTNPITGRDMVLGANADVSSALDTVLRGRGRPRALSIEQTEILWASWKERSNERGVYAQLVREYQDVIDVELTYQLIYVSIQRCDKRLQNEGIYTLDQYLEREYGIAV